MITFIMQGGYNLSSYEENVFISTKARNGYIYSRSNAILRNNVLLSLEWIDNDNGKGNSDITFDIKKSNKLTGIYVKISSIGESELMKYANVKLKP